MYDRSGVSVLTGKLIQKDIKEIKIINKDLKKLEIKQLKFINEQ